MDDPNLTMEEYIKLEEEKAHKREKVFNWQTAIYGKIRVDDDLHNLSSVEAEFPAIVINDAVAPQDELQCKSQVSTPVNDEIDFRISLDESDDEDYTILFNKNLFSYKMIFVNDLKTDSENDYEKVLTSIPSHEPAINCFDDLDFFADFENANMALPPREQRHRFLRYEGMEFPDTDIVNFKGRLARIHRRKVSPNSTLIFNFGGLPDLMAEGLSGRMLMEHRDEVGVSVFTSRAWRRMFDIRGPLVHGLILEFFSTFRFGQAILDLDTPRTLQFQLGRAESARQIPDKGDLRDYWMGILSAGDFLGTAPSYTLNRDLILRLCHRLIACSIAGRSQTPEKVTVTDLFYLRGMDVDSVNVPYLLARYLRLFAAGRKSGAHIYGGQFVARLAEHFGLLTVEILGGLMVIAPELPIIDMTELVRLQIFAEDAPIIDEGGLADPAPQQPPPPLPAHARTMPQRMARLEEDMHEIRQGLTEQREVIDTITRDFSRFSTWVTTGLGQMMDRAGVAYTLYAQTRVSYQRYQDRNAPVFPTFYAGPCEGNINEYWWRIYKSENLEVLES
ncbi:hypothetical protein Tco_0466025 [Tanacetum coccineum]